MQIECKLQRDGGTKVDMGTTLYHFAPLPDGAHVAEVTIEQHIDRFLSISEAYRLYRADRAPEAEAPIVLLGSSEFPASFDINGKTVLLTDVIEQARAAVHLAPEVWNAQPEEARADMIDAELDKIKAAAPLVADDTLRAELVEQFKAKFGKAPHHNAGVESIRAKLAE